MNELQIFENEEFGRIRSVSIDEEPWLAGKDVAIALGYKNTKDAIITHIDEEDRRIIQRSEIATIENHLPKDVFPVNFVSGEIPNRGLTFVNESGLYALIFGSKLESAKRFKHWVTSEVLPTLRKTGSYHMGPETVEQTVTVTETRPYENPHTILEASKIMSGCLEGNRPYVLNILRHIVPDIDDLPEKETVTEVNAEVKVKPKKDRPNYWKQGVPIDVDKMLFTAAEQGITIEQLAEKAAVTVNTMTNWITKKHKPVLQNRINVCMALGKDENFLTPRRERRRP